VTVLRLPTRTDSPHYDFEIDLDSVTYQIEFRWNDRAAAWFMEIRDVNGVQLLSGRRVVLGYPLLARFRDPRLPAGDIYAVDLTGSEVEPGVNDLGGRVSLLYYPRGDMPSNLIA
jgi:hypothetical protein